MSSGFLVSFSHTYLGRFSIYVYQVGRRTIHYLYERIQRIWNFCCFLRRQNSSAIPDQRPIERQVDLQPQAPSLPAPVPTILTAVQEASGEEQTPRAMTPLSNSSEELLEDTSARNLYPGYFEGPIRESMPSRLTQIERQVANPSTHSYQSSFQNVYSSIGQVRSFPKEVEYSVSRSVLPFERSVSLSSDDSFDSQETYRSSVPQRARQEERKQTVSMIDMIGSYFQAT